MSELIYEWPKRKRGLVAYYYQVRLKEEFGSPLRWVVLPKEHEFDLWPQVVGGHVIRVPLSGLWYQRPTVLNWVDGRVYVSKGWKLKLGVYGLNHPTNLWVWMKDVWGSRVGVQVDTALDVINTGGIYWSGITSNLFKSRFWHDRYEKQKNELVQVLEETVARLDGTRNFIRSKQAQEIREWLNEKLKSYKIPVITLTLRS